MLHYRPKRSFGQGNIFRSVCHSVHGGGCLLQFLGGVVCSKFLGGCLLQIFGGSGPGGCLQLGGCLLQIFRGGVCSKFSGGCLLQIFGGVSAPNFRGVWSRGVSPLFGGCLLQIFWGVSDPGGGCLQFSEYGQRSAGRHPTGMHS